MFWKGAIAVQRTLFTRQQLTLTLRRSFTSANAQLSLDFGMLTTKNVLKQGVYENETELSKYICGLKRKNNDF